MQGLIRPQIILRSVSFIVAVAASVVVWIKVPIEGNPWLPAVFFIVFAALAELLAVNMGEDTEVEVTPTSPILWAATCILGPFPAIIVGVGTGIMADLTGFLSYKAAKCIEARCSESEMTPFTRKIFQTMNLAGTVWEPMSNASLRMIINTNVQYVSALVITVALSGLVYHYLGGRIIIGSDSERSILSTFLLPYVGMALSATAIEHLMHMIVMSAIDPVPGAKGIYGMLLRMKLVIIENTLPVAKAELFLTVVGFLIAYLYMSIGMAGFLVAVLPIIALRDFFSHWVQERTAYVDTLTTLGSYMQQYHPYTKGHLERVADMSVRLARELKLPAESVRFISTAGLLHDIGKIGVSEEILDKPGQLDDEEWAQIKEHPVKGAQIISHLEFLEGIVDWIKYHHKWHNGQGYPATKNKSIPIEASIIAVADSFDAMTDDRELSVDWKCDACGHKPEDDERPEACPKCGATKRRTYREPRSLDDAINELRRGAGTQFHPKVVKAFLAMVERDGIRLNA